MKRPVGIISAAVVCALLGLQAGTGSASAVVGEEGPAPVASTADARGRTGLPAVSSVAARPDGGTRAVSAQAGGGSARHDYNGDGRSDMAAWYDYGDGHDALRTFLAGADGGFAAPGVGWETGAGTFSADRMKHVTGDFNGDGIGDVAAFNGYDDGRVTLFTWLGTGSGTFAAPFSSWTAAPGNWTLGAMTAQAGDLDGDGRDDIAVWYDYGNGDDKLFTLLAGADGGFGAHFSSFERTDADGWHVERMKFATGDYNGDGRDDLGVLYGYASGTVTTMVFTAKPGGGFNEPVRGWESTGWTFGRTSLHSGDFDGDGRDDLAAWYDYSDGHDALISFELDADGRFGNRREILNIAAGSYSRSSMKIVTGDYNGDGRDDLATLYGYSDGRVKTITFTAKADGSLNGSLHSWESAAGNWTFGRVRMIEGYNSPRALPVCPTVYGHGGYPTGANAWERDQVRAPNHPKGLAQQKSWGAGGVEADLQLTRDGTKGVMWHNTTTRGLSGTGAAITDLWWATGADQLKGRTITRGPYAGETVYTFREWLDSARSQQMAVLVELKGETRQSLLSSDASIRETAWNEVVAPISERASAQKIMIYTHDTALRPELERRIEAAGLGATLKGHPAWVDTVDWEEPAPSASGNYASWQDKLARYGSPVTSVPMATTWTKEFTSWLNGKCV
ncbi:FG-GAP-like repeat-containing protein [Streptomyces sp. NPDC079167]|uniref:FG-GAP-like repeat-containing protein n=1 Tax=Streptomyces sp. NPDC079167 TaxID=3154513 RepID=UPI0034254497